MWLYHHMIMAIACFENINVDVGYNFVTIVKHTLALMFYFWWKFVNFILKKMILTYAKEFSWKNGPNLQNFEGKKIKIDRLLW
jgi:uncharacterized membrane protein